MTEKEYKTLIRKNMYEQIRRLRYEEHMSIQRIANHLGINFRTVKRYLELDPSEFEKFSDNITNKPCALEQYTDFVVERLSLYQDTSTAQMHDWLKENYPDFPEVSQRTVYNFVMKVRQEYKLPKIAINERVYGPVPETPPGKYAQVDFGHKKLRTGKNTWIQVHFMVMLLSYSRYKFIWFQEKPFTSESASIAHEKAFEFFHGIPKYIIYDQDAVFLYSENRGDYIMTEVFDSYVKSRPFKVIYCRPADPESKGKVENAVKYVKQNFLHNRPYHSLENLNEEAISWLNRTGNMTMHGTTCKVPYDEWCRECKDLLPYTPVNAILVAAGHKVLRTNCIRYRGNTYSLPAGTYKDESSRVFLTEEDGDLIICDDKNNVIARHRIPAGKGQTIINKNHLKDRSVSVQKKYEYVISLFNNKEKISLFLNQLKIRYPRYMRDQLCLIEEGVVKYGQFAAERALDQCIENKLYSANHFKSFISASAPVAENPLPEIKPLGDDTTRLMVNFDPNRSTIQVYEDLFNNK